MKRLYARDHIDLWHAVQAVDSCSSRVQSICGAPPFIPSARLTETRPDPDSYCLACLAKEQREAKANNHGGNTP